MTSKPQLVSNCRWQWRQAWFTESSASNWQKTPRLGAAVVLKWSLVPEPLREQIVQQALAIGNYDDEMMKEIISRLLRRMSDFPGMKRPSR